MSFIKKSMCNTNSFNTFYTDDHFDDTPYRKFEKIDNCYASVDVFERNLSLILSDEHNSRNYVQKDRMETIYFYNYILVKKSYPAFIAVYESLLDNLEFIKISDFDKFEQMYKRAKDILLIEEQNPLYSIPPM